MARALALMLAICTILAYSSRTAESHHNVYLPFAGETWMAQEIKRDQEQVWCVDARAAAYPNFVAQLRDVNGQFEARVGIRHRQVDYADPACEIKHTMPDGITCNGWAGRIYYANKPVVVEYCWPLGYTDFRTVHGHELGHGILGQLHEQYVDSGSIQCTGRQDTVMDCGSGVRYPTPLDVSRGCAIILTTWCGQAPAPENPQWTGTAWRFDPLYLGYLRSLRLNTEDGEWYDDFGRLVWGDLDPSWGGRWNDIMKCHVGPESMLCSGLWIAAKVPLP